MALPPFSPFRQILACSLLAVLTSTAHAATLRGEVVDPDRRPVPGARVLVSGPLGTSVAITDAAGSFELTSLGADAYRVRVERPGFDADPVAVTLAADETRALTIVLRLAAVDESVIVSAAHVPQARSDSPAAATVVTASDLRGRQIETTADALRLVPGFTVARSGGRGGLTSAFPRGGESDFTLVLVDGLRQNSFGGGFDFALLPLGDVERIEVIRGPQSAVFGADAVGGVVQVVTRHEGAPAASGLVEGGGFGTWRAQAGGRTGVGRWTFSGGAERSASDGFTETTTRGERVSNDDWRQALAHGAASVRPTPASVFRADVRWLEDDRGFPGPFGSDPGGTYGGVDRVARGLREHLQAGFQGRHPWGAGSRVQQQYQITVTDIDGEFASAFGDSTSETRRVGFRAQTDAALRASTGLSFGVEALGERARSTFITDSAFDEIPVERRVVGAFVEGRQALGPRVTVTAGVRAEHIRRDALPSSPSAGRPDFPADTVVSVNPRAGVVWLARPGARGDTTVRVSAGTGIRPPDAFEIAYTDNPGLKPERSRSIEAGVTERLLDGRLAIDATFFANDYDDLIVSVGRSMRDASRYLTDNIANARARGLELSAAWRPSAGVSARAGYTFLDTEVLDVDGARVAPPPFTAGDPLIRRPRHQATADVTVVHGRLSAFAIVRARGRTLDIDPSFGAFGGLFDAAGYGVADAGVALRVARGVELHARALNLFDRAYEEVLGYPALGRSGIAGVRIALGQ